MDPFNDRPDLEPVTLALTRHPRHRRPARGARDEPRRARADPVSKRHGASGPACPPTCCGPTTSSAGIHAASVRRRRRSTVGPNRIPTAPTSCRTAPTAPATSPGSCRRRTRRPISKSIRVALGEERLDYLGYSYGTIIGATFAADHPDRVGHFVLDGDHRSARRGRRRRGRGRVPVLRRPTARSRRSTASPNCAITARPASVTPTAATATGHVARRPRRHRRRPPDRRLRRATRRRRFSRRSTASSRARCRTPATGRCSPPHCAMLATATRPRSPRWPQKIRSLSGERQLGAGRAVVPGRQSRDLLRRLRRTDRRVHVLRPAAAQRVHDRADRIGRRRPLDPGDRHRVRSGRRPGYHAAEFADALGDAVHIIWEGVGHTAFPASSRVRRPDRQRPAARRPAAGRRHAMRVRRRRRPTTPSWPTTCSSMTVRRRGTGSLGRSGGRRLDSDTATCVGQAVVRTSDDRTITHIVLGVDSDAATEALADAERGC